jgi:hypothetical protein
MVIVKKSGKYKAKEPYFGPFQWNSKTKKEDHKKPISQK